MSKLDDGGVLPGRAIPGIESKIYSHGLKMLLDPAQ